MARSPFFIALVATLLAGQVHAESWRAVTGTSEGATFVELDGRVKSQEGIRVWSVSISAKAYSPMMGVLGNDVQIERTLYELDCNGARIKTLQTSYFSKEFRSRGEFNPPSPRWTYIAPGSIGETLQKATCGAKELPNMGPPFATMPNAVNDYFGWLAKQ